MKTKLFIMSIIAAAVAFSSDVGISHNGTIGRSVYIEGYYLGQKLWRVSWRIFTRESQSSEVKTIDVYCKGDNRQQDTDNLDHTLIESQLKPQVVLRPDGIYEITFPEELRSAQ